VRLAGAVGNRPALQRPRRRALRPTALGAHRHPLRESRRTAAHIALWRRGLGPPRPPTCRSRSRPACLSRAIARPPGPRGRPARAAGIARGASHPGRGCLGHLGRDGAGRRGRLHRPLSGPRLGARLHGLRQCAGGARGRSGLGRHAGGSGASAGTAPRASHAHSARHRDRPRALARKRPRRCGHGRVRRRGRVRGAHARRPQLAGRARRDRPVRWGQARRRPAWVGRSPRSGRRARTAPRRQRVARRAFRWRSTGRSSFGLRPRRPEEERRGRLGGHPSHATAGERSRRRGPDSNRGHGAARSDWTPPDRRRPKHPRHRELRRRIRSRAANGADGLPHRLRRAAQLARASGQPARAIGVLPAPVRPTPRRSARAHRRDTGRAHERPGHRNGRAGVRLGTRPGARPGAGEVRSGPRARRRRPHRGSDRIRTGMPFRWAIPARRSRSPGAPPLSRFTFAPPCWFARRQPPR
jgi:hypothetical protein